MTTPAVLTDRIALVTGAGSGIGAAIAEELARVGAYVLVQDLRQETAATVANSIRRAGGTADPVGGDVSNPDDVRSIVDGLVQSHDRVDILVNNAGLQHVAPIEQFPLEQWHRLLGVLLTGPFLLTQAVLPPMRRQQWGRIINIASVQAKQGDRGKAAYCSAKYGLIGLTRVAALETATDGITVNAICPGLVDTPLVRNQLADLAALHLAPAGSGKTQTMINCVVERIRSGVKPDRILLLTFDNSAATSLKTKLREQEEEIARRTALPGGLGPVRISTLNAFGYGLLREDIPAGYRPVVKLSQPRWLLRRAKDRLRELDVVRHGLLPQAAQDSYDVDLFGLGKKWDTSPRAANRDGCVVGKSGLVTESGGPAARARPCCPERGPRWRYLAVQNITRNLTGPVRAAVATKCP
jgi:3-hydroxybutyrate dehydrogenase